MDKYHYRAYNTAQDLKRWFPVQYPGYPAAPDHFWMAQMRKFNIQEQRWVNKGPVLFYFLQNPDGGRQWVGSYLYSTNSVALNLQSTLSIPHLDRIYF